MLLIYSEINGEHHGVPTVMVIFVIKDKNIVGAICIYHEILKIIVVFQQMLMYP